MSKTGKWILFVVASVLVFLLASLWFVPPRTVLAQLQAQIVGGCVGTTSTCRALNIDSSGNLSTTPSGGSTAANVTLINSVAPTQTASGGLAVTLVEGAATTDYAGTGVTVTTLAATPSTTTLATATTYVTMLRCFNTTGSAVSVNRQDTAGNNFEVAYSIPANSNYYLESPNSFTKMVGIKLSASAGSSLNCIMSGKQ